MKFIIISTLFLINSLSLFAASYKPCDSNFVESLAARSRQPVIPELTKEQKDRIVSSVIIARTQYVHQVPKCLENHQHISDIVARLLTTPKCIYTYPTMYQVTSHADSLCISHRLEPYDIKNPRDHAENCRCKHEERKLPVTGIAWHLVLKQTQENNNNNNSEFKTHCPKRDLTLEEISALRDARDNNPTILDDLLQDILRNSNPADLTVKRVAALSASRDQNPSQGALSVNESNVRPGAKPESLIDSDSFVMIPEPEDDKDNS